MRAFLTRKGFVRGTASVSVTCNVENGGGKVLVTVVEGEPGTVGNLRFPGATRFTPGEMARFLGAEAGKPHDFRRWEEGLSRLRSEYKRAGFLTVHVSETVERCEPSSDLLCPAVQVEEGPQYDVRWEGVAAFTPARLAEVAGLRGDEEISEGALVRDLRERLVAFYRGRDYLQFDAAVAVEEPSAGRTPLIVTVVEGKRGYIKDVRIVGNRGLSEKELRGQMTTRGRGVFHWITGSGKYRDEEWNDDLNAIVGLYQKSGYARMKVLGVDDAWDDRGGIVKTIRVEEGPRYRVREIVFQGNDHFLRSEFLAHHQEQGGGVPRLRRGGGGPGGGGRALSRLRLPGCARGVGGALRRGQHSSVAALRDRRGAPLPPREHRGPGDAPHPGRGDPAREPDRAGRDDRREGPAPVPAGGLRHGALQERAGPARQASGGGRPGPGVRGRGDPLLRGGVRRRVGHRHRFPGSPRGEGEEPRRPRAERVRAGHREPEGAEADRRSPGAVDLRQPVEVGRRAHGFVPEGRARELRLPEGERRREHHPESARTIFRVAAVRTVAGPGDERGARRDPFTRRPGIRHHRRGPRAGGARFPRRPVQPEEGDPPFRVGGAGDAAVRLRGGLLQVVRPEQLLLLRVPAQHDRSLRQGRHGPRLRAHAGGADPETVLPRRADHRSRLQGGHAGSRRERTERPPAAT